MTVSLVTLRLRAKVPRREAACQAARLRLRLSPGRVTVTVATESDRLNPTVATESDHHGISGTHWQAGNHHDATGRAAGHPNGWPGDSGSVTQRPDAARRARRPGRTGCTAGKALPPGPRRRPGPAPWLSVRVTVPAGSGWVAAPGRRRPRAALLRPAARQPATREPGLEPARLGEAATQFASHESRSRSARASSASGCGRDRPGPGGGRPGLSAGGRPPAGAGGAACSAAKGASATGLRVTSRRRRRPTRLQSKSKMST